MPFEYKRHTILRRLNALDEMRTQLQEENSTVGKVLDATDSSHAMLSQLASSLSNIQIQWQQGRFLGGGSFGNVYVAVNLDSGDLMAVKEIRMHDPKTISNIAKAIKDEMTVLEMLDHPNVVSYYGIEVHRDKVYIFMEYCPEGSLANLLEHGPITDEAVVQVYALEMLEGLAYLHGRGIAHRDLKPENLLLDQNGVMKFVDFGAAKIFAVGAGVATQNLGMSSLNNPAKLTGTPMYMAPEGMSHEDLSLVLNDSYYGHK